MVQLSSINMKNIFTTFARNNYFYEHIVFFRIEKTVHTDTQRTQTFVDVPTHDKKNTYITFPFHDLNIVLLRRFQQQ